MIRLEYVQTELFKIVGWDRKSYEEFLSKEVTQSESGLTFQHAHPLLTLDNLSSIAPEFKNAVLDRYDEAEQYKVGDLVIINSFNSDYSEDFAGTEQVYKCLQAPQSKDVPFEELWMRTSLFSEWLADKTKASIQKAIFRVSNSKTTKGTYKKLCENKVLFDITGRISDTILNKNNFVGFEIVPARSYGVTTSLNRVNLQFTKAGKYKLYVFNSSREEPAYIIEVTKQKNNSSEWFDLKDINLPYLNENEAGGSWYIGYLQNELPEGSQAIRKDKDWSKGPCNFCSRKEYASWIAWSKYLEIHPFKVPETEVKTEDSIHLWDIEDNIYDYTTNYGLNLDITVACDISDLLVEQRGLFTDIIAKQVAVDMLREFVYNANVRTNRHSMNASKLDIMYELDGDSSSLKKSGLNYQLDKAYDALEISLEGIDRICLPCKNNGIKYRSI